MAVNDKVLGQFPGDDEFPVHGAPEDEQRLFWGYDDLHCPQPLSLCSPTSADGG